MQQLRLLGMSLFSEGLKREIIGIFQELYVKWKVDIGQNKRDKQSWNKFAGKINSFFCFISVS